MPVLKWCNEPYTGVEKFFLVWQQLILIFVIEQYPYNRTLSKL